KEEGLQRLNDELERRVNERTLELRKTISELDEEKRRISWLANVNRAVLDATTEAIRLVDAEGKTLVANAAIERLTTEVSDLPADSTEAEGIAEDPEAVTLDEFELAESGRSFQRYTAPVRDASEVPLGRIVVIRE